MWPFKVRCRCSACASKGKAQYATFTTTREESCPTCSGTGEIHKTDVILEDVVNAFGFKTGTRRVGTRPRVDPCPACGARGRITRTERRRVKIAPGSTYPATAEVGVGDSHQCLGRGVLEEGLTGQERCGECGGLGFYWFLLFLATPCRLWRGKGLIDTNDHAWVRLALEGRP
jgi:DnaJ-class molecular chaperone